MYLKFLLVIAICCIPKSCWGGFLLTFSSTGTISSYDVAVDSEIEIPVYLIETTTSQLTDHGLEALGFRVSFVDSVGSATPIAAPSVNPLFSDLGSESVSPTSISGAGVIPLLGTIPKINPILFGTFRFCGNQVGNSTVLTLSDLEQFGADTNDIVLGNGTSIDDLVVYGSVTLNTITAVPEPSSVGLCLVAASLFQLRRAVNIRKGRSKSPELK